MSEDEDLYENPFFAALKKQFAAQYAKIEEAKHVILVPSSESISATQITKELVGMYMLRVHSC